MKKILFIKLGGSLITDKTKPYTKRQDRIKRISYEIAQLWKQKKYTLIIGNGAGSFGHYEAKKYETDKGFIHKKSKKGFSFVHKQAEYLNKEVVHTLISYNIPAVSIAPLGCCVTREGKIIYMCTKPIQHLLMKGITPVLYGDVVVDEKRGCAIVSTDYIFFTLAKKLTKQFSIYAVIHVGITDGIYVSKDKTIPHVNKNNFSEILKKAKGSDGIDVTGGMYTKLKQSFRLAKYNIPSYIINGTKKNQMRLVLSGKKFSGTHITYE